MLSERPFGRDGPDDAGGLQFVADLNTFGKPLTHSDRDGFALLDDVIGRQTMRQVLARKEDIPRELRHRMILGAPA